MDDQKRGKDAADKAPQPRRDDERIQTRDRQDGPNYTDKTDVDRALPLDEVNSANDE